MAGAGRSGELPIYRVTKKTRKAEDEHESGWWFDVESKAVARQARALRVQTPSPSTLVASHDRRLTMLGTTRRARRR